MASKINLKTDVHLPDIAFIFWPASKGWQYDASV